MWESILHGIAWIVELFFKLAQDWGLAIILFTVVFRLLLMPLMLSQTRSSYQMQKIQPKIKQIQDQWSNDPVRLQEETQKLYAEAKFNPLASCIPMLIQMPIFIALFQVLRNIQDFLPEYSTFTFYNIIPYIQGPPEVAGLIAVPSDVMAAIGDLGFMIAIPYIILIIVFVGATFLPMLLQQRNNQDQSQKNQMYMMSIIMGLMMLFVSWSSPAGVLLFWGVSGIIAVATQQIYMSILKKKDAEMELETIDVAPVKVEVERKTKKKRPTKKR
ncbi:MAG: YidC/Oxa1 family membrane protein insertase [Coriobacteriaceae bacterium]|jgi:YidC/Oxa1 family membrane protein insertase|nr:YidC/Oxa1 family membrane protein insertase [Coriobacteriaceae bacterium]